MCCRQNANKRAQKALVASTASQQPKLPEYTPYGPHAAGTAGLPLGDVYEGRRNRCCRRSRRGPLVWRLGQFIYSRAQEQHQKRQLREVQGPQGLAFNDVGRGVVDSVAEMPPSYDRAMGTTATEKHAWADGKGV